MYTPFALLTINEHVLCALLSCLSFQSHSNIDQYKTDYACTHSTHESCAVSVYCYPYMCEHSKLVMHNIARPRDRLSRGMSMMVRLWRGMSMMVRPSRGVSMMVRLWRGVSMIVRPSRVCPWWSDPQGRVHDGQISNLFYINHIPKNKITPLHIISLHELKHLTIHSSMCSRYITEQHFACTRVHTHTTHVHDMTWHTSRIFVCLNNQPTPAVVWLVAALQQQWCEGLE